MMISLRSRSCLLAAALSVTVLSPSLAGSPDRDQTISAAASAERLAAAGVLNVPDRHGCEKWCLHDMNPCDPPLFKRTDGRCEEP